MAISRQKKEASITSFQDNFARGKIVVFVNIQGMGVGDMTGLRTIIRETGGSVQVLKKTLIQRVLDTQSIALDIRAMEGEVAAVFGFSDEVGVVKAINTFAKELKLPEFRAGIMGSALLSEGELRQLALIPGREVLLAQMVGSMAAPMSGIVNVFAGTMRNFVYALSAIGEKK